MTTHHDFKPSARQAVLVQIRSVYDEAAAFGIFDDGDPRATARRSFSAQLRSIFDEAAALGLFPGVEHWEDLIPALNTKARA